MTVARLRHVANLATSKWIGKHCVATGCSCVAKSTKRCLARRTFELTLRSVELANNYLRAIVASTWTFDEDERANFVVCVADLVFVIRLETL